MKRSEFSGNFYSRQHGRDNKISLKTATSRLHNKGQEAGFCLPWSSDPESVDSASRSPNKAHQYLANIALCPPGVTGTALNSPRLEQVVGAPVYWESGSFPRRLTRTAQGCTPARSAGLCPALRETHKRGYGNGYGNGYGYAPLLKCQGEDFQESELGTGANTLTSQI